MTTRNPGFSLCVRAIQRINFIRSREKPVGEGLPSVPGNLKDLRYRQKSTEGERLCALCVCRENCLIWMDPSREWGSGSEVARDFQFNFCHYKLGESLPFYLQDGLFSPSCNAYYWGNCRPKACRADFLC